MNKITLLIFPNKYTQIYIILFASITTIELFIKARVSITHQDKKCEVIHSR